MKNKILHLAVASCFGIAASQAMAVVNINATTVTPVKVAKELVKTATTLTDAGDVLALQLNVPNGYVSDSANPLYIKLQLSSGVSFATAPQLTCATGGISAATIAAEATGMSGDITIGGNGNSAVTFLVSANGAAVGTACIVSGFNLTIPSGGATPNITVSATVEYKNGLSDQVSGSNASYITFAPAIAAVFSGQTGNVVIDATSGSDNFASAGDAAVTNSAYRANLGYVAFNSGVGAGTAAANTATMGAFMTAAGAIQSGTVTVSGPLIPQANAAVPGSGVFLALSGDVACATKTYLPQASGSSSITFTGITVANLQNGLNVCVDITGNTTSLSTGQITASIDGTAVTNVSVDFSASSYNLENVSKNGKTKNAYFVNASTSTSKTSILRFVNTGGNSGTITATAYAFAAGDSGTGTGTVVGTQNAVIGTLASNESLTLTSADLESKLGYTPSSGTVKYRVVFSAGLADFKVLNFTKDVTGGYITLSQSQDD